MESGLFGAKNGTILMEFFKIIVPWKFLFTILKTYVHSECNIQYIFI